MPPSRRSGSARRASSCSSGRSSSASSCPTRTRRTRCRRPSRPTRSAARCATARIPTRGRRGEGASRRPRSGRPTSSLRERDFARYGPEELRRARALVDAHRARRAAAALPALAALALAAARLDPRRTLREAMRTGGVPLERAWREPQDWCRASSCYLVDVSGSMEPYARAMVMFLQAAVRAGRHVEAFTFGTRLTRLTPHLAGRDPDRALANAARAVPDWAGGTRIGENLKAFNDVWGRRGITRGRDRRDRLRRLGARRRDAARRADGAPAAGAHTLVWIEPARRRRGLPAAGRRHAGRACRMSTFSCPVTTCARSRRWPRFWRRSASGRAPPRRGRLRRSA